MAERIEHKVVTIPASTAITSPQTFDLQFSPGVVRKVHVLVPPGPNGLMGFRLGHSGQVIIPFQADSWFVTDDERLDWDMEGYPTGDAWFVQAYNEGLHDHSIYLRFLLDELPDAPSAALTAIDFG